MSNFTISQHKLFDAVELAEVWKELKKPAWQYCAHAGGNRFWDYPVYPKNIHGQPEGTWYNPASPFPGMYEKARNILPEGFELIRAKINGQTQGQQGFMHKDGPFETGYFYTTCLVYLNEQWQPDWAGETVFFNDERQEVYRQAPEPGVAVTYSSTWFHQAQAPTANELRVTMAFQGRTKN